MNVKHRRAIPFLLTAFCAGAPLGAADVKAPAPEIATLPADPAVYVKEVETWRRQRLASLKREDGWLTLVGLYWLKPGANRFGSDPGNPVILPEGKAPGVAGTLVRDGDTVRLNVEPGLALTADGKPASPGMTVSADASGKPTILELGSLSFYVIKRGDRLGVRIKDKTSPMLTRFQGIDEYPIRPEWRIEARFEPYKDKKIPIANIIGQVAEETSPGAVVFDREGKTYRVDALEGDDGGLFLVFGDQTNGSETYGAGRFLDTGAPRDGKVVVDFNTAYNPPCAFTAFATCPLPPAQNKLALRVEAGEKKVDGEHSTTPPPAKPGKD
jgi:uncharacterized protein (DUF1684 family)